MSTTHVVREFIGNARSVRRELVELLDLHLVEQIDTESFKYPGGEQYVIEDIKRHAIHRFSLEIKKFITAEYEVDLYTGAPRIYCALNLPVIQNEAIVNLRSKNMALEDRLSTCEAMIIGFIKEIKWLETPLYKKIYYAVTNCAKYESMIYR